MRKAFCIFVLQKKANYFADFLDEELLQAALEVFLAVEVLFFAEEELLELAELDLHEEELHLPENCSLAIIQKYSS